MTEARRLNDIADRVFDEWHTKWKYPLAWETRVAALKRLIADALREEELRVVQAGFNRGTPERVIGVK